MHSKEILYKRISLRGEYDGNLSSGTLGNDENKG